MVHSKYKKTAGIEFKREKRATCNRPSKKELIHLYRTESRSVRNIAELLGCSKDMVYRALKEYRIERRKHSEKRSKLMDYDSSFLCREIKKKGFSQVARELGVHKSTLTRYMKEEKAQG